MQHATQEFTEAQMLIRKPAATVFEALTNPEITTKFWFTHSSGALMLRQKSPGPGRCTAYPHRWKFWNL